MGVYSGIKTPIHFQNNYEINCVDKDGDNYCNWGISENKPYTCPSNRKAEKDCDDSDSSLGPFDSNFNCIKLSICAC